MPGPDSGAHAALQPWGAVSGKPPRGKGPRGVGQHQECANGTLTCIRESGRDFPSVLGTVLDPSVQEAHGGAGACPEKGNKVGGRSGAEALRGAAEGAGVVYSGDKRAQERSYCSLQLPEGR